MRDDEVIGSASLEATSELVAEPLQLHLDSRLPSHESQDPLLHRHRFPAAVTQIPFPEFGIPGVQSRKGRAAMARRQAIRIGNVHGSNVLEAGPPGGCETPRPNPAAMAPFTLIGHDRLGQCKTERLDDTQWPGDERYVGGEVAVEAFEAVMNEPRSSSVRVDLADDGDVLLAHCLQVVGNDAPATDFVTERICPNRGGGPATVAELDSTGVLQDGMERAA
jgi:hypothetical protein